MALAGKLPVQVTDACVGQRVSRRGTSMRVCGRNDAPRPSTARSGVLATLTVLFMVCSCGPSEVLCELVRCGSRFTDVPSRTVLAPIVFQGSPKTSTAWTEERGRVLRNFTFSVVKVFKGSLPKGTGGSGHRDLIVGVFGNSTDKAKCINPDVSIGLSYIVFLNSTVVGRSKRLNIHRVTSFPELSTEKVINDVVKYSRNKNAQLPKAKIQNGSLVKGTLGSRLQLVCKVTGKPSPVVEWIKNDRVLQPRNGVRVTAARQGSKLQISKLNDVDNGTYRCQASNALGSSKSAETHILVGQKAHSHPCPNQNYCQNNGTCFIAKALNVRYCHCSDKFEGERCQLKKVDFEAPVVEEVFELQNGLPVVGVALAAIVLTSIIIFIYLGFRSCRQRHNSRKAEELSENSYRPYNVLEYQEESLKSNKGKRRSKSAIPKMKDVGTQIESPPSLTVSRLLATVRPDGIPSPHSSSHQRSKIPSGKVSSLQRARLNGISTTPPDSLAYQHRVRAPVAKTTSSASNTKHKAHSAKVIALDDSPPVMQTDPIDVLTIEESRRKSEYDNCWLEEDSENPQSLITYAVTEQNHPVAEETSDSDLNRNLTTEQLKL